MIDKYDYNDNTLITMYLRTGYGEIVIILGGVRDIFHINDGMLLFLVRALTSGNI